MAKRLAIAVALSLLVVGAAHGANPRGTTALGLRLGLFSNLETELDRANDEVRVFNSRTNFYLEVFANYYLTKWLAGALNLGSYTKGEITFNVYVDDVFDGQFLGQATIYPMQLGLKINPFDKQFPGRTMPYLEGGGAFIIGRETATIGPYDSYWYRYTDGNIDTETAFGWWLGSGAEIPLTETVHFDVLAKYLNSKFSGDIAGIRDYTGWQFSLGIIYRLLPK